MILEMQRRFAKRHGAISDNSDGRGYQSFSEASRDIERLVDLVWLSGTREYGGSTQTDTAADCCLDPLSFIASSISAFSFASCCELLTWLPSVAQIDVSAAG